MRSETNRGITNAKNINARVNQIPDKEKGITLISLVITIIILLILAGVAISIAVDSNGLFARARKAAEDWNTSVTDEQTAISNILNQFDELEIFPQNKPNAPELLTGMTPVKFTLPEGDTAGTMVETNADDPDWYNYEEKMWANAKTADGSLWVWIPRYAYKLNPSTQTAGVIFLQGITDNYYDVVGDVASAKRCTSKEDVIDTTKEYVVHPAFTDESGAEIDYRNGGWDKELSGIWVAKFEAGYAEGGNAIKTAPVTPAGDLTYSQADAWVAAVENTKASTDASDSARNWLDGVYEAAGTVSIKYPTFQPLTYSMNYINYNDAFLLCRQMEESGNIYGFVNSNADTHMMKDSEWGAVAYLSKSAYGLEKTDIYKNNITLNSGNAKRTSESGKNGIASVYAVTGVTEGGTDNKELIVATDNATGITMVAANNQPVAGDSETRKVYKWNQIEGQKSSSTGNMYGIYDLSGGMWERSAIFVENDNANVNTFGKALADAAASDKTKKYVLRYSNGETGQETSDDNASWVNYFLNSHIYGTAINETSTSGTGSTSWYSDFSYFVGRNHPFSVRGGGWDYDRLSGLFCFYFNGGGAGFNGGFRAVVVAD